MEMYLIGKIVNTHGLKGLMRFEYYLKDPLKIKLLSGIYLGDGEKKYNIIKVQSGKKLLLSIEGIESIEDAEKLKNKKIYISNDEKNLLIEDKDEYFIDDIIGMKVYNNNMEFLGTVTKIYQTGKNDVYQLDNDEAKLIPASKEFIKKIDVNKKCIIVELIEGLI
jgi:16S rRNA processing protein RimM